MILQNSFILFFAFFDYTQGIIDRFKGVFAKWFMNFSANFETLWKAMGSAPMCSTLKFMRSHLVVPSWYHSLDIFMKNLIKNLKLLESSLIRWCRFSKIPGIKLSISKSNFSSPITDAYELCHQEKRFSMCRDFYEKWTFSVHRTLIKI